MNRSVLVVALCLGLGAQEAPKPAAPPATPIAAATPAPAPPAAPAALQDDGLLDPAWFGAGIAFAKSDDVDFFWVKPGLNLAGRTIQMKAWEDPSMLRKGRDGKDNAKATELTDAFPAMLRGALAGAFNGKAKVSRTEGDLTLTGRFVDANAGNKVAKQEIAMIKVAAPNMALQVIDWAMQVHGGAGISDDFPLAAAYAQARTLRYADGPDEVHRNAIAKQELGRYLGK